MVERMSVSEASGTRGSPAATVAQRDRYVDLLRLFAVVMVALGHWVLALLALYGDGGIATTLPAMLATWVWQVMPLFFFLGGFVHARALCHHPGYGEFCRARMTRLVPPAVVFVAVATAVAVPIELAGAATGQIGRGLRLLPSVLWFLGVYLLVVLAAPAMIRVHRRYGLRVVAALGVAVAAVDALASGGPWPRIGALNVVLVWLAVHQLGFGYADGLLLRGGRRLAAALTFGGLAATAGLIFGTGAYPVAMVGLPGHGESNMSPPTLALLTQSVFLIGVALLARPLGLAWLRRERVWRVVATGNTAIMTIYCWHPVAIGLVAAALRLSGVRLPAAGAPIWPVALAGWLVACALCTAVAVLAFGRMERCRPVVGGAAAPVVIAALAAAFGFYILSQVGLDHLTSFRARPIHGVPVTAGMALVLLTAAAVPLLARPHPASPPREDTCEDRARPGGAS